MLKKFVTVLVFTFASSLLWAQSPAEGAWNFKMDSPMGAVDAKVTMMTDGATLTGEFDLGGGRTWPIEDGTVDGNNITFNINRDGASMTYVMSGSIDGDSMQGTAAAMGTTVDWSLSRGD
jgi:hypothetical protein